jgi:lysophospholipase L1-like esterase
MDPRSGVLALGDSITNGGGELQWGVALQGWAHWVARGLGLPYTTFAEDGARAADVVARQIPALTTRSARPDARYDLGCLHIGVNDVRAPDWDRVAYAADLETVLDARCDRVLLATIPTHLGRPRARQSAVDTANALLLRAAARRRLLLLDLRHFGARNLVMVDAVHPTAFGQIAIAEQALEVLGAAGVPVLARPRELVHFETTRWGRLRGDATYAYRQARQALRSAAARVRP